MKSIMPASRHPVYIVLPLAATPAVAPTPSASVAIAIGMSVMHALIVMSAYSPRGVSAGVCWRKSFARIA